MQLLSLLHYHPSPAQLLEKYYSTVRLTCDIKIIRRVLFVKCREIYLPDETRFRKFETSHPQFEENKVARSEVSVQCRGRTCGLTSIRRLLIRPRWKPAYAQVRSRHFGFQRQLNPAANGDNHLGGPVSFNWTKLSETIP